MTDLTNILQQQPGITDPDCPDGFQDEELLPDPLELDAMTSAIANPPGQTRLTYRVGDYATFLQSMLLRLHSQTVTWKDINNVQQSQRPLRHLNITQHPNWIVALLQAWAVVGDVLTFYQEQIANEGYLATATESLSVWELLRTIGYDLQPGVAASTYLAFTVLEAPTAPNRVTIPVGTAVQSLPSSVTGAATPNIQSSPTQDQLPVTFETIASIEARVSWNTLSVYLPTQQQQIRQNSAEVFLQGVKTGIRPGDGLLLLTTVGTGPEWSCRVVQTVVPNPAKGWTQVGWQLDSSNTTAVSTPQVLTFRKQASLFGKNIPKWDTLPDKMKQQYGGIPQGGVLYSADSGQTWQSVHQAFIGKTVRALTMNPKGSFFAATDGGVLRSLDHGQTWQSVNVGLTSKDGYALTQTDSGDLLVGSSDGSVFRLRLGSDRWEQVRSNLQRTTPAGSNPQQTNPSPIALYSLATGINPKNQYIVYVIGTERGVLRSLDDGNTWTAVGSGLPGWNKATATVVVYAVVIQAATGRIIAGTDRGIFVSNNWGDTWLSTNQAGIPTYALLIVNPNSASPLWLAGTDQGIFRSLDGGKTWQTANQTSDATVSLTGVAVRSLVSRQSSSSQTEILAGTDRGLYRSQDQGNTWTSLGTTTAVSALVASGDGQLLALTPFLGILEPTEQLRLAAHQIDLDRVYPGIASGSWIMLQQAPSVSPPTTTRMVACKLTQVTTATRQIRSRTMTVTRLTIDPSQTDAVLLQPFDPRQTVVLVQSEAIALLEASIYVHVRGQRLRLSGADLDLQPGQTLSLVGKHPTMRLVTERAINLTTLDGLQSVTQQAQKLFDLDLGLGQWLQQGIVSPKLQSHFQDNQITLSPQANLQQLATTDRWLLQDITTGSDYRGYLLLKHDQQVTVYETVVLQVIAPATTAIRQPKQRLWRVMTNAGLEGTVTLTTADYRWEPATQSGVMIGEMVRILDSKAFAAKHYTLVSAHQSLRYLYDPRTVTLYGNVAPATHGETVRKEVLGTGDASRLNQQFVLKRPPLTYVPAPTPDGTQNTLEVRVRSGMAWGPVQTIGTLNSRRQEEGVLWSEVPSLVNSTPQDHHYTVRISHEGKTTVNFGDGKQGARLPSGLENVEATYRSGMGAGGNLEPGRLVLLKNRPPGIRSVTNPLLAAGGTDTENLEAAKRKAPLSLRTLQRIISLTDYEDFASSFAGVAQAQVLRVWNGRSHVIHLTVAAADGNPADPVALLQPLQQAIVQFQAASQLVQIDSFLPVFFNLSANVLIQPDMEADSIHDAITQSLTQTFSFANRQFGQPIAASEVITAIQVVSGVVSVDLLTLYRYDAPPLLNPLLSATSTHWDTNQQAIIPAELLQINSRTGVNIVITNTVE